MTPYYRYYFKNDDNTYYLFLIDKDCNTSLLKIKKIKNTNNNFNIENIEYNFYDESYCDLLQNKKYREVQTQLTEILQQQNLIPKHI